MVFGGLGRHHDLRGLQGRPEGLGYGPHQPHGLIEADIVHIETQPPADYGIVEDRRNSVGRGNLRNQLAGVPAKMETLQSVLGDDANLVGLIDEPGSAGMGGSVRPRASSSWRWAKSFPGSMCRTSRNSPRASTGRFSARAALPLCMWS